MTRLRRFIPTPYAGAAALVLTGVLLVTVFGDLLAPYDPITQDASHSFGGTSAHHLLGTDVLGRDTLSRLIVGTRVSVLSAAAAVAIGFIGGAVPGMLSAFLGRSAEYVLMRAVDSLMTIPPIIFAIAMIGSFGNGLTPAIFAIGILMMPRFFRVVRAETLGLARSQYVEAATLLGASRFQVARRHVWRKILPTAAVTVATGMGGAVLAMSGLSFLGLGVIAPAPSWGSMLSTDLTYVYQAPYAAVWPGLAIVLTVWACNALADGVRGSLRSPASLGAFEPTAEEDVTFERELANDLVAAHGV